MNMLLSLKSAGFAACAVCMFSVAAPVHATYRFTYNSQPIHWNFSVRNQDEYIDVGSEDMPDFSLFFDVPNSWLQTSERTEFMMPTPTIRMWNETVKYTVSPGTSNVVSMYDGDQIWGWLFNFDLVPVFAPDADPLTVATNRVFNVSSASNMASCPCDNISISMNDIAWVGGKPIANGTIGINYRALNSLAPTWTITPISAVPEPESIWMMASGLGLLGWLHRRKRRADFHRAADRQSRRQTMNHIT
jgi:hypothetical protein